MGYESQNPNQPPKKGLALSETQVQEPWQSIARLAWIVLLGLTVILFAVGTPILFAQLQTACDGLECGGPQPTAERLISLEARDLSRQIYAGYIIALEMVTSLVYVAVAAVILWRRSNERAALLAAYALALFPAAGMNITRAAAELPILQLPAAFIEYLGQVSFFIFLFIFPDGRFVPGWTRWLAVIWGGFNLPTAFFPEYLVPLPAVTMLVFLSMFGLVLTAQIYRYRLVSGPLERQQAKWAVAGITTALGILIVGPGLGSILGWEEQMADDALVYLGVDTIIYLCFCLIPISIAFAILRSRLYDIDILIRRTIIYTSLTVSLALVYFGSVVLLQNLSAAVTGSQSTVAIVISTLAIAALFTPLRRRMQKAIDRRFYRHKYDAEKALASFALAAREEVDLERLAATLLKVVEEAIHPERLTLWLNTPGIKR